MAEKRIDLNKSVYELSKEYPEIVEILANIGFKDITKAGMINSVGRFMTIPKGALAKKIDIDIVIKSLKEKGFIVYDNN